MGKKYTKAKGILSILLLGFFLGNCVIDYKDYPKQSPLVSNAKDIPKKLVYNLPYFPAFNLGGREALEDFFQNKTRFAKTEMGTEVPLDGYFVDVKVNYRSPTTPALVFLAASSLTATLLPAWSLHDGYDIRYELYKDGKKAQVFSYQVERLYGQWIFALPFIWLNWDTATEKSVFERVSQQFMEDAKSYF